MRYLNHLFDLKGYKKIITVSLVFISAFVKGQNMTSLDSALNFFLKDKILSDAHVGIQLYDLEKNSSLINYNAQKLFVPASILKLFTSAISLEILKKEFTFKTNVMFSGELEITSGTLNGNVYIFASGDPSLQSSYFSDYNFIEDFTKSLKKKGIKKVLGSLHIVDSTSRYCANGNWLWSDIGNYYGAGTSLVSFRDNSVDVFFNSSDSVGGSTIISKISPENDDVTVLNKVIVGASNRDLAYGFGSPYNAKRTIKGEIPRSKKDFKVKISMHDPSNYIRREIEQLIYFENQSDAYDDNLDTLMVYTSPTLLNLLKKVNFSSNNHFTEHILFKTMLTLDSSLSYDLASNFNKNYWTNQLQLKSDFNMVDGCGLSRKNLISPEIMNKLLIYAYYNSVIKSSFQSTLPISGISGTLKYLGKGTSIENNFIGKSGSMDGIRCYSGYFVKRDKFYPLSVMLNNFSCTSKQARDAITKLMVGIYDNL